METETVEDVLALITDRPADPELFQRLGHAYTKAGQVDEARQAFERSLELDPDDAFTHLFLGNWFGGQSMYREALLQFQLAATLLPDEAVVHWCLADAYKNQGRFDLAHAHFQTGVRVAPEDPQARRKLAEWDEFRTGIEGQKRSMVFAAYHNDYAATTVLLAERWLRDHPDDLGVIYDYAMMLYQMARYDEAIRVYMDAIERFPDDRWGLYNGLGNLYRYRGDFSVAELWYQKAVDENPDEATSYVFLGAVQARQGKLKEAETTHRKAIGCSEGCIDEAHHNLGLVLRGQGRLAEAAVCFRQAIDLCPAYPEAIEALEDIESALVLSVEHVGSRGLT